MRPTVVWEPVMAFSATSSNLKQVLHHRLPHWNKKYTCAAQPNTIRSKQLKHPALTLLGLNSSPDLVGSSCDVPSSNCGTLYPQVARSVTRLSDVFCMNQVQVKLRKNVEGGTPESTSPALLTVAMSSATTGEEITVKRIHHILEISLPSDLVICHHHALLVAVAQRNNINIVITLHNIGTHWNSRYTPSKSTIKQILKARARSKRLHNMSSHDMALLH